MPAGTATARTDEWAGYFVGDFPLTNYPPHARVLDVGFGHGEQLRKLRSLGCHAFGIEYDPTLARKGGAAGLAVCRAQAERLPFAPASMDGIVCKVVIPYTDEARAVQEIARVLRPGGVARIVYHGPGYFLKYLLGGPGWKRRLYGARSLVNTLLYRAAGRRLPGFWGDTIFQSRSRLDRYYRRAGLRVVNDPAAPLFMGAPVFIYHEIRRMGDEPGAGQPA